MKGVEGGRGWAYTDAMTSCLSRLRARRNRRHEPVEPLDPTRPTPVRVEDGVPIAHDGPPGFPGPVRPEDEGR